MGIVFAMFVLACFYPVFTTIVVCYLFMVSFFLKTDKLFRLQLFVRPFQLLIFIDMTFLGLMTHIFIFGYIKNWIIDVVLNKKKISYKPLLAILLILVYQLIFPIYKTNILDFLILLFAMITMYFIYEKRNEIDFAITAKTFVYSVVCGAICGLFISYSPRVGIVERELINGILRFFAVFFHPNIFSDYAVMAISVLLVLKHLNKIEIPEFLALFITVFVFGFMTLSRAFIMIFAAVFAIFAILELKKNGRSELKFLLNLAAIVLAIMLLMEDRTYAYIVRVYSNLDTVGLEKVDSFTLKDGWWVWVLNGVVKYDPGRIGLWELYIKRIFETVKSVFFGYGISAPNIGQMHSHNILLGFTYTNGIIGMLLMALFVVSMTNKKAIKTIKEHSAAWLFVAAYFMVMLLNNNNFGTAMSSLIMLCFVFCFKSGKPKPIKTEREKMIEMFYK